MATFATATPAGYSGVDGFGDAGGQLHPMDGTITDDPSTSMTMGSGTPSVRHFFISAQSFAERMNGVFRRTEKCASISRK
jgi:hypothetical protein